MSVKYLEQGPARSRHIIEEVVAIPVAYIH